MTCYQYLLVRHVPVNLALLVPRSLSYLSGEICYCGFLAGYRNTDQTRTRFSSTVVWCLHYS